MKKIFDYIKKKIKIFSFLSIILLIICVNVVRVNADYMDQETVGNRKERQLLDKIDAIKSVFPNQIDKEALYATLAHRGTFTDYVNDSYEEDFDINEYQNEMNDLATNIDNFRVNILDNVMSIWDYLQSFFDCIFCNEDGTDNDGKSCEYGDFQECVISGMINRYVERTNNGSEDEFVTVEGIKTPQNIDLLMAATIVMLDSSGWTGNYSDENYQKALAGDQLVGNMFDKNSIIQNALSVIMNGVFCAVGQSFDLTVSWFNPGINFGENGFFTIEKNAMANKLSRFYTMSNICKYGFIGGTYDHVKNPDLSTDEGKDLYQKKKDVVAKQIINLAKYYRGDGSELDECVYYGASGAYDEWKQMDDRWKDVSLGSSTLGRIGCTTTSVAIQIARSGTKISSLPDGYTEFNPGALGESAVYDSVGNFYWDVSAIAPNVKFQDTQSFTSSSETELANKMSEVLSTPVEGQYQPFVVLQMYHNGSQHWVAVQGVQNGQLVINDPARDGTSLSENYSGESWQVVAYKVMYATDVPFGSSSSSSSSSGGSYSDSCGTGEIQIPEEFGNGGFTVTYYLNSDNNWNWDPNSNQGNLYYNYWLSSGAEFDNGIAVYEGRYLIACTEKFGKVGDKVDFFLDDGTRIPCIIADAKRVTAAENSNEWGHSQGQNIIEFEVSRDYFNKYGNPGSSNWFPEWAGKRVASATNLGENVLGI